MALKTVMTQDYNASYTYAPPLVQTVVNSDHVVSATVCTDVRGEGPWYRLMLANGATFIAKGRPSDLIGGE